MVSAKQISTRWRLLPIDQHLLIGINWAQPRGQHRCGENQHQNYHASDDRDGQSDSRKCSINCTIQSKEWELINGTILASFRNWWVGGLQEELVGWGVG